MEKDILEEVIEAEKEIQKSLELEKRKACEWLAQRKKEIEEELLSESKIAEESLARSAEAAVHDAEMKARQIIKEAEAASYRLDLVKTEKLARIVGKQIAKIIPKAASHPGPRQ